MSTPREPIDQVLAGVEHALSQQDVRWAGAEHVRQALGWPEDRLQEVKDLMAELVEAGDLRGPRSGPLRDGSGRVVDADVSAIAPQGRRRLERARRPPAGSSWRAS